MKSILLAVATLLAACGGQTEHPPQAVEDVAQPFVQWSRVAGSGCLSDVTTWNNQPMGLGCTAGPDGNRIIKRRQSNGTWTQFTETTLAAIASDGLNILGVQADSTILRYTPATGAFSRLPGAQGAGWPFTGSVAIMGQSLYVTSGDGKVYLWHFITPMLDQSFWARLAPDSPGFAKSISVDESQAVTVVFTGCGSENVYYREQGTNTPWNSVGFSISQGCFVDATGALPGSFNFHQWWGSRPDGIPRQWVG